MNTDRDGQKDKKRIGVVREFTLRDFIYGKDTIKNGGS
jgi:hypothetical protein